MKKIRTKEYFQIFFIRFLGNFLLLTSLFFIAKTFYQPIKEEIRYFLDKKMTKKYLVANSQADAQIQKGLLAKSVDFKSIRFLVPEDPWFSIIIPKIGANAHVIANVDPVHEAVYLDVLKKGVAHAAGTAFPGEGGHIFLFAHSTDYFWNVGSYNAVFYLLYKLDKGDQIILFYKNQRYNYRVVDKKVVDPSQVEYLTRKTNSEFLTLQTCWPPGTTLKRIVVFAVRAKE